MSQDTELAKLTAQLEIAKLQAELAQAKLATALAEAELKAQTSKAQAPAVSEPAAEAEVAEAPEPEVVEPKAASPQKQLPRSEPKSKTKPRTFSRNAAVDSSPVAAPAADANGHSAPVAEDAPPPAELPVAQPLPVAVPVAIPVAQAVAKKTAAKNVAADPADANAPEAAPSPEAAEKNKNRWSPLRRFHRMRRMLETTSAFTLSLIVHMVVLILLAVTMMPQQILDTIQLLTIIPNRPEEELLSQELDLQITTAATDAAADSASGEMVSNPQAELAPISQPNEKELSTDMVGPQVSLSDVHLSVAAGKALNTMVPYEFPGEPSAVVDSYAEAMDRITQEILAMLSQNKVLLIWCFDESESMKDDQREIRDRIEVVYKELGLTTAAQGDALWSSVCSYGSNWTMHTKRPTGDLAEIRDAIDQVPSDPTGKEIMCSAVGKSIAFHQKYAKQAGRDLALVLVTDESGEMQENRENLEAAIAQAQSARCRIFVLGREAVFGYPFAFMRWQDPMTKLVYWRQINRGPESPEVEQLQTNGFYRRYDAFPSGFGPYEQVRMARETGGVFFLLPSLETNLVRGEKRRYELEAMRPYLPSLQPRDTYLDERQKSVLRTKLYEIILLLNPYDPDRAKHVVMRHHFSINAAEFALQLLAEQEKAKQYFLYLEQAEKEMEKLKPLRENEPSPRWQANYDLVYAQLIAYRVRLYEYGTYLETFKRKPKPLTNPLGATMKTTHWELRLAGKMLTGDRFKTDIDLATQLFKSVVDKHPGTPWAARAQQELARGFGVELVEDYHDPRRTQGMVKLPNL